MQASIGTRLHARTSLCSSFCRPYNIVFVHCHYAVTIDSSPATLLIGHKQSFATSQRIIANCQDTIGKSDPFLEFSRRAADNQWQVVLKTEVGNGLYYQIASNIDVFSQLFIAKITHDALRVHYSVHYTKYNARENLILINLQIKYKNATTLGK